MEASVLIMKDLKNKLKVLKYDFIDNFVQCSMSIPLFLGEAHSLRFGDHKKAILLFLLLENAMAGCNKMVQHNGCVTEQELKVLLEKNSKHKYKYKAAPCINLIDLTGA